MKGWVACLMVGTMLAGCLADDAPADPARADPVWAKAWSDPFFDGAVYDAAAVDPEALSKPVFDILPVQEVWVDASDGMRLHQGVYRPDTDEPVPVFVNFSPYWGNTAETRGDPFGHYLVENLVPRGYAVVLSALRGTGHSEGCFPIGGDREVRDAYEVIDHFAKADWSNGHIATGGKSYDSTTQNGLIAKDPHPALKAAFHVSGITDMYRYSYREGVPYANGLQFTPRYFFQQGLDEITEGNTSPEALQRAVQDVACQDTVEHIANGEGTAVTGLKTDYWQERDWNRYIADSSWNGSIFFVHGFQDWNVKPDHILPWTQLLPDDIHVLAWLHQDTVNAGHVYPMRADWNLTFLRWLDHELKGIDTGLPEHDTYWLEGSDGTWRHDGSWPYSPEPVALDGDVLATADDVALRYSGQMAVTLPVTVTNPDGVVSIILYDEAPDGTLTWMNEAVLRIPYHDGLDSPAVVAPGSTLTVTAEFYPQDDVLQPGHRWVLMAQEMPRYVVTTPLALDGVAVDLADAVVDVPWAPMDALAPYQPRDAPCHAC